MRKKKKRSEEEGGGGGGRGSQGHGRFESLRALGEFESLGELSKNSPRLS